MTNAIVSSATVPKKRGLTQMFLLSLPVAQWALLDEIEHLNTSGKPASPDGELAQQFYRKIEWTDMTCKPFIVPMEPPAEGTGWSWDYLGRVAMAFFFVEGDS